MTDISICSYSFHRLLAAGEQDAFQYIEACGRLGCTQLDPWNGTLIELRGGDDAVRDDGSVSKDGSRYLSASDGKYIEQLKQSAGKVGVPFGCIAVDGAHVFDDDLQKRRDNRARAYRWMEVAARLGAKQVRIDSGGSEELSADEFAVIKEGFGDLIAVGNSKGVEVLIENHWGPTKIPDNVVKMLDAIPGLGLLWDSHNWKRELRDDGRVKCAKYARCTHLKTFAFDAAGNETSDEDATGALGILKQSGYHGCWGVESVPEDGDEMAAAARTIELIKRVAGQGNSKNEIRSLD